MINSVILAKFTYKNTLENIYGVGYTTNKHYERSDSTSEYRYSGFQINPWIFIPFGSKVISLPVPRLT